MDEIEPFEVWKPIPGYEDTYMISSLGRVRSLARLTNHRGRRGGQLIKTPIKSRRQAHRIAYLSVNGVLKQHRVGRLMALAFHGEPEPGQMARHLDGDALNNHVTNIAWGPRPSGPLRKRHRR